jgi:hypothetical protein
MMQTDACEPVHILMLTYPILGSKYECLQAMYRKFALLLHKVLEISIGALL